MEGQDRQYQEWRKLVTLQERVRRKLLAAKSSAVLVRRCPAVCACVRDRVSSALTSQPSLTAPCKSRKRSREHPSEKKENQNKRRKQTEASESEKKAFSAFLQALNDKRSNLKRRRDESLALTLSIGKHVAAYHQKKEEEHLEKLARIQQEKIDCLRRSDLDGYLKLASEIKSTRVQEILQRTQGCLRKLHTSMESLQGKALTGKAGPCVEIVQPSILSGGALHAYQVEGLKWLVEKHDTKINGILADEMGLGKTVQVIALISFLVETRGSCGPYLIAAPASVLPNWIKEFSFWAPTLKVVPYAGSPEVRHDILKSKMRPLLKPETSGKVLGTLGAETSLPHVVVTTYEMLMSQKDKGRLFRISWEYMIMDEGHRLKNSGCRLNAHLKQYNMSHRLLLSGTPIQNNLNELWSLLNFLLPSVFDSSDDFNSWFSLPLARQQCNKSKGSRNSFSTKDGEAMSLSEEEKLLVVNRLHQMLRPLMLRRLKSSVLGELPKKRECLIRCAPSAYQELLAWYVAWLSVQKGKSSDSCKQSPGGCNPSIQENALTLFKEAKQRPLSVSNAVMELRVICNHPFLSKIHTKHFEETLLFMQSGEQGEQDKASITCVLPSLASMKCLISSCGKLEVLHRLLTKLWAGGHRVLIFCTMTKALDIIEEYLEARAEVSQKNQERGMTEGLQLGEVQELKSNAIPSCSNLAVPVGEQDNVLPPADDFLTSNEGAGHSRILPGEWKHFRLDGTTSKEERDDLITEFNSPHSEVFLFLLSIRAGGVGINLQGADTVIIYDTDWNPQIDLQAQARSHRMGQKKEVLVIRLETAGSVEQRVRDAAEAKLGLANQSVTAGFFDGKTIEKDRRKYLEDLFQQNVNASGSSSQQDWCHPTDTAITEMIYRSDAERSLFQAIDEQIHKEQPNFDILDEGFMSCALVKSIQSLRES